MSGVIWNTTYSIKYKSDRPLDDSISAIFHTVEMSLSTFKADSRISRINRNETAETDSLIEKVLETSIRVNRLSAGAFDPTLSPLIKLWGFGPKTEEPEEAPTREIIDSMLLTTGISYCRIIDGTIEKKSPATTFNFSAITKGYACDLISEMLARNGVTDCMIEIGGEIVVRGHNDRRRPWRIMIEAPSTDYDTERSGMATLELTDCAIASSGNYRNYRENADGERYGHTISATTGRPVKTTTLATTVIAPTCALADALATAAMAMPPAEAIEMLEKIKCEGIIVTADSILSTETMLEKLVE